MVILKDIIVIAVLIVILSLVVLYIIRAKKRGQRCIGCNCKCSFKDIENGCKCNQIKE